MKIEPTKKQGATVLYLDEYSRMIGVHTHNTRTQKRLTASVSWRPECCRRIHDDEQGMPTFEIWER